MNWRRRLRARSESGAVAVEFGLLVPLLLMLVFGILDFGWMMNRSNLINNASRDGARIASLDGTYDDVCNSVKGQLNDAGITPPTTCNGTPSSVSGAKITLDLANSPTSAGLNKTTATAYDAAATTSMVAVLTVSYDYKWITPMMSGVLGSSKKTLTETTRMVVE
jgi:Flp pilus assembly protein TadG